MGQEINTKNAVAPLEGGEIRPNDTTTVYSTGKGGITQPGEPMEVHVELAKKLIASGKATKEQPKESAKNAQK